MFSQKSKKNQKPTFISFATLFWLPYSICKSSCIHFHLLIMMHMCRFCLKEASNHKSSVLFVYWAHLSVVFFFKSETVSVNRRIPSEQREREAETNTGKRCTSGRRTFISCRREKYHMRVDAQRATTCREAGSATRDCLDRLRSDNSPAYLSNIPYGSRGSVLSKSVGRAVGRFSRYLKETIESVPL